MRGRDWHIGPERDDYEDIRMALVRQGNRVDAEQWQSTELVDPMKQVIEFEFCTIMYSMPVRQGDAINELHPNMPWAEQHFKERVGGEPVNPPPSHVNWPFAQGANEKFTPEGKFSHTYPERLWATGRYVTPQMPPDSMRGITHEGPQKMQPIANLNNLVQLLSVHPTTRQAFIPIWWPIDGVMAERERVPCTIGYHFLLRDRMLHCHYFMRSCDAMRHLPDDLYMATRLTQWLCDRVNSHSLNYIGEPITPGVLAMQITSLHIFEGDVQVIEFMRSQRAS